MIYDSAWNTCNCTFPSQVSNGTACVSCPDLCSSTVCINSTASTCIKCGCPCLGGFYLKTTGDTKCTVCNYNCLSCSSASCTCPSTMYKGSDGNSCKACYYACVTCQGAGSATDNNCTTCDETANRVKNNTNCSCIDMY